MVVVYHGGDITRRRRLCQRFSFGRVRADSGVDEVLEVGFTSDEKIFADSREHFLASRSKLGLGDFEGELFALAGANESESCPCPDCGGRFGQFFGSFVWCCNIIHGTNIAHHNSLSTPYFSARQHYVLSVMRQFQKSRIKLLEELKDLVTEALTEGREYITRDIRRRNRTLKAIRKEVSKWMTEMIDMEKLKEQERRYNEEKRKEAEANAVARSNDHQ